MPPRMIPDIDPQALLTPREGDTPNLLRGRAAEAKVYAALREQLPNNWTVVYGYDYVRFTGRALRDGEVDFIVSAPRRGLMFLEVKAAFGFECVNGNWRAINRSGERQERDDPFAQASRNKHNVVEKLARRLGFGAKANFPGLFGHLVLCPTGRMAGALPFSQDPLVFLGANEMNGLHEKLLEAFTAWGAGMGERPEYTAQVHHSVSELLTDNSRVLLLTGCQRDFDEQRIEELTSLQYEGFRQVLLNRRVLVKGTAGSGKTMIAMWAAEHLAAEGQSVMFVCYNKPLAEWLRLKHPGTQVRIVHFHAFCQKVIGKAPRQAVDWAPESEFWKGGASELVFDAYVGGQEGLERYDTIIVDEAQDFHGTWWDPLQVALKDPSEGRLCAFLDPQQQGVYGQEAAHPADMFEWTLDRNCRNTRRIVGYCSAVLGEDIQSFELSPEGVVPEVRGAIPNLGPRAAAVRALVNRLLAQPCCPSSIALLSPWGPDNEGNSLANVGPINGIPVRHIREADALAEWRAGRAIIHSTIKSFKGLEADHVIVTDLPAPGQYAVMGQSDLFVAASRARHRLYLFPVTQEANQQLIGCLPA